MQNEEKRLLLFAVNKRERIFRNQIGKITSFIFLFVALPPIKIPFLIDVAMVVNVTRDEALKFVKALMNRIKLRRIS